LTQPLTEATFALRRKTSEISSDEQAYEIIYRVDEQAGLSRM